MLQRFLILVSVALTACGGGALSSSTSPSRDVVAQQALTQTAELLEFEPVASRAEMFREVAKMSLSQAGRAGSVMFPVVRGNELVAAPGFDARTDLLLSADAGSGLVLVLNGYADAWAEDRRESFQGLSEREAAELVARSLLNLWAISPSGPVVVERASKVPWAAAYTDGILRVNPSFVYMAAALAAP